MKNILKDINADIELARRGELGPEYLVRILLNLEKGIKKIYKKDIERVAEARRTK